MQQAMLTQKLIMQLDYKQKNVIRTMFFFIIWPQSPVANVFRNIKTPENFNVIINSLLYVIIYPLLIRYPKITFTASISDWDHAINSTKLNKSDLFKFRYAEWYKLLAKTPNYYPVASFHPRGLPKVLSDVIGSSRYVVIQVKDLPVNASYLPTNPDTYLDTLKKIRSEGYKIVFAGREKFPRCFGDLGIIDYANSDLASPENDYYLVRGAYAVLSSASGFGLIAETLGIPLLQVNCWNYLWQGGFKTLILPSVLHTSNRALKFKEQYSLAVTHGPCATALNESTLYECMDAEGADILNAWNDLQRLINRKQHQTSSLQREFLHSLPIGAPLYWAKSSMPESFLDKNIDLIK
jgi:putative glycosyltransferase (TIGR04372 family)